MQLFNLYLQLGFEHIADFAGYDHILFIITLSGVYLFSQWRQVLILVTAFTIGHSITLALASLQVVHFSTKLIEFLIPVTIFITALANIMSKRTTYSQGSYYLRYAMALFFGLIHGLGFSNYLRSLLGLEVSIIKPLFAFNLGLELGQIFIVFVILSFAYLFVSKLKTSQREWNLIISGAGLGISLIMCIERFLILTH
jgi:hypothetical protein